MDRQPMGQYWLGLVNRYELRLERHVLKPIEELESQLCRLGMPTLCNGWSRTLVCILIRFSQLAYQNPHLIGNFRRETLTKGSVVRNQTT